MTTAAALQAFMTSHALMGELLERLQKAHANFLDTHPDRVNWGDVGSVNKVCSDLEEICRFIKV